MHAGVIDDGAMDGACAVCGTSGAAWYNSCSSCCMNTAASFSVFSWVFLAVLRRTANTFWTCVITPLLPGPPRPIFSICGVVLGALQLGGTMGRPSNARGSIRTVHDLLTLSVPPGNPSSGFSPCDLR